MSDDYSNLANAFVALWDFCETELGWMYFRNEFLIENKDSKSSSIENANILRDYLHTLRDVPAVSKCLQDSTEKYHAESPSRT